MAKYIEVYQHGLPVSTPMVTTSISFNPKGNEDLVNLLKAHGAYIHEWGDLVRVKASMFESVKETAEEVLGYRFYFKRWKL